MKSLEHITITTGASRRSPRSEVGDDVVARIRAALAGSGELWADWSVKLLPTPDGAHTFDILHRTRHIARCWLCEDPATSAWAWQTAVASGIDPGVHLHAPKSTPWLAVALVAAAIPIAMKEPSVLSEAGDVERCVAWAILE